MPLFTDLYAWATASGRRTAPTATNKAQGFGNEPATWGIMNDVLGTHSDALNLLNTGLTDTSIRRRIPPSLGGWQVVQGSLSIDDATGRAYSTTPGSTVKIALNLQSLYSENDTDPNAEWVFESVRVVGARTASGSLVVKFQRGDHTSWTTQTLTFGALDTDETLVSSFTLTSSGYYRVLIEITPDGADAASDVYVELVDVTFTRNGVP